MPNQQPKKLVFLVLLASFRILVAWQVKAAHCSAAIGK